MRPGGTKTTTLQKQSSFEFQEETEEEKRKRALQRDLSGKGRELLVRSVGGGAAQSLPRSASGRFRDPIVPALPKFVEPTERIPTEFDILDVFGGVLVGDILVRIQSKKFFRKWKTFFFVLSTESFALYPSRQAWELKYQPVQLHVLTEYQTVAPILQQTTGSVGENEFGVYYSRVCEVLTVASTPDEIQARNRAESTYGGGAAMTEDDFKTIVKFGSKNSVAIVYLTNCMKRAIEGKQMNNQDEGLVAQDFNQSQLQATSATFITRKAPEHLVELRPQSLPTNPFASSSSSSSTTSQQQPRQQSIFNTFVATSQQQTYGSQQQYSPYGIGGTSTSLPPPVPNRPYSQQLQQQQPVTSTKTTTTNAVQGTKSTSFDPFGDSDGDLKQSSKQQTYDPWANSGWSPFDTQ
jgi:hypothetical protein